MKKRGHKPDAHTYTIMLRGFTMNHKKPNAVEDAMKVYESMFRPESIIKPSIIHSNAIINCLGRALNMDALWSVAGRLPEGGPGSADKWTYTTILNTMQACAVRDAAQLAETDGDLEAAARLVQTAITEGRKLWEDIISRWRSGDINIDQTLVCAMGRLLLLGQKRDWDDIFSLVEQTMLVPRVKPPFVDRQSQDNDELEKTLALPLPDKDDGSSALPLPDKNDGSSDLEQLELAVADEAAPKVKNEFAVVDLSGRPARRMNGGDVPSPYANVGNNVLSLLLEAAIKLREIPVGKAYWEKLTKATDNQAVVMPDENNLHSYLRLLRLSRSSKEICDVLRQSVSAALEGVWYRRGTFVVAMSTCARDFKNPNVFTYASSILDLMQSKLPQPDLKVMRMYLSLAVVTTPGVSTEIPGVFNASAGENNLIKAVRRFSYSDLNFQSILNEWIEGQARVDDDQNQLYVSETIVQRRRRERQAKDEEGPSQELVEFLQDLNSVYDKLLNFRSKMTEKMATSLSHQKAQLSADLQLLNADPLSIPISKPERYGGLSKQKDSKFDFRRFPDKPTNNWNLPRKSARLVDVDKIHPFQRDLDERGRSEQRTERNWEATRSPREGGQSDGDLRTAIIFGSNAQRSERDSRSAPPFRGNREDQWPGRGARGSREVYPPGRDSRESRGSPEDYSAARASGDSRESRGSREDYSTGRDSRESRGSRGGYSTGTDSRGSGDKTWPERGSRASREDQWPGRGSRGSQPQSNKADRQWAKDVGGLKRSEERRGRKRLGRQDDHSASLTTDKEDQQGIGLAPMSGGWDKAWKQSVRKMGGEERRKDWVVV
jgi:hypothetical protein